MNYGICFAPWSCQFVVIAVSHFKQVLFNIEDHLQLWIMEKSFLYQLIWSDWESDKTGLSFPLLLRIEIETHTGKFQCIIIIILVTTPVIFQRIYWCKIESSIQFSILPLAEDGNQNWSEWNLLKLPCVSVLSIGILWSYCGFSSGPPQ